MFRFLQCPNIGLHEIFFGVYLVYLLEIPIVFLGEVPNVPCLHEDYSGVAQMTHHLRITRFWTMDSWKILTYLEEMLKLQLKKH